MNSTLILCVIASMAYNAEAAIINDGIWSAYPWYSNSDKFGVNEDGTPYSKNAAVQRFLTAPLSFDGEVENYMNMKNVSLVSKIFPEE